MKLKSILAVALLVVSSASHAEKPKKTEAEYMAFCKSVYDLSKNIMIGRQGGTSMIEMIETAKGNGVAEFIVNEAFKVSRKRTEEYINRSVEVFSNKMYQSCYQDVRKKFNKK